MQRSALAREDTITGRGKNRSPGECKQIMDGNCTAGKLVGFPTLPGRECLD